MVAMIAPPSVTETNELRKPVPENRRRIQASARRSNAIAASASSTANRYWDEKWQRMQDVAQERADAGDRAAQERAAAPGSDNRCREALRRRPG